MLKNAVYFKSPARYVSELRRAGQRRKAAAFLEYCIDVEEGEENAVRFYAKSWGVSKSTACRWLKDFQREHALFEAAMEVEKRRQDSSVQKGVGHLRDGKETQEAVETTVKSVSGERRGTDVGQSWDKDIILNDDDSGDATEWKRPDPKFEDLFFIYRMNNKFAGKKEEAEREWEEISDTITYEQMKRAIMFYLHDPEIEKRYNFANFMRNRVYLSYMPKRIRVKVGDEWKVGTYDDKQRIFSSDDGFDGYLDSETLARKFANKELEFVR